LDVGRVLQQRKHAPLFSVLCKRMKVEKAIIGACGINFEIARMDHHSKGRMDSEGDAIHKAVRHLNGIDGEGPKIKAAAGANFAQIGLVEQLMLVQLIFNQCQGELGTEDRNIQLRKDPGQSTDMVFMAVSKDNATDFVAVVQQVSDIGNNNVDPQ